MARIPMVTRTISTTIFEVMTLDISSAQVNVREYILTGTHENSEKTLKELKKIYETEYIKLVHIEDVNITTALYGMTEQEFIQAAQILPDR